MELFLDRFKKEKMEEKSPIKIEEKTNEIQKEDIKVLNHLKISHKAKIFFFDQMTTLIDSEVSLIDALKIIKAQTKEKNAKKLYNDMIHKINTGMTLAETMVLYPKIFPSIKSALIDAGEKSGNLKVVLFKISKGMSEREDFVSKIKGAMFYPVILIFLAIGMLVIMLTFVIPKISTLYSDSGVELPILTKFIIALSDFTRNNFIFILLGLILFIVIVILLFKKIEKVRLFFEILIDKTPIIGKILKEQNLMNISSNLSMLLDSGILISDAFEITEKTINNIHYKRALLRIRKGIVLGKNISNLMGIEDLENEKIIEDPMFPLQVAQLIHIGEVTGTISKMLDKIQSNYKKSINFSLKNISTVIEPLMIFIVALIIGFTILAVMIPFFKIGTVIH